MDKVIFQSKFKGLSIRVSASKSIKFSHFRYDTSDSKEIEFLRGKKNVWEVRGDPPVMAEMVDPEFQTTLKEPAYSIRAKKAAKAVKVDSAPEPLKKGGRGRK